MITKIKLEILRGDYFRIPLNYEYSSLVGINTGLVSEKVELSKLKEDIWSAYEFYTTGIYKVLDRLSSRSIDISFKIIDLSIWVFLNMYEKENPGILPKLEITGLDPFNENLRLYSYTDILSKLTRNIRIYSRFSKIPLLNNISSGSIRPDEDPIRNPLKYPRDYILEYYTFHEYPSVEILDRVASEFSEYKNEDPMSSTRFLIDNREDLCKIVMEYPEYYIPDCIKLFLSFYYKTI